jgi:hypothetical protein
MSLRSGKLIAIGVLLLGMAACAPVPSGPPRVVVEGDAFSTDVTILGVQILDNQFLKPYDKAHWYLRSFVNPQAHTATHQLYAELIYADGRNGAYFASDSRAESHRVDLLYHQGCGPHARDEVCTYEDTIGIDIPEATLRANAAQGLDIKVTARSGYARIMAITPEMISAQLYATQEILSGKVVVGQTVKSGGTIAAGPPAVIPRR